MVIYRTAVIVLDETCVLVIVYLGARVFHAVLFIA